MKLVFISLLSAATLCSFMPDSGKGKIRLVIDAAHGGNDNGALSASGDKESTITLQFAEALAQEAKAHNIEVVMTRKSESDYKTLEERAHLAPVDEIKTYFISLHANSSEAKDPKQHGIEVIFTGVGKFAGESSALAKKLTINLRNAGINETNITDRGKNLVVIRDNNVPAIAIETGYMTNAEDLARLKNPEYQKKMASLIVASVMQ
jgi:N-acetylmuramoyl-L-alanine amidase